MNTLIYDVRRSEGLLLVFGAALLVGSWVKFLGEGDVIYLVDAGFRVLLISLFFPLIFSVMRSDSITLGRIALAAIIGVLVVLQDAAFNMLAGFWDWYHNTLGLAWGHYPPYSDITLKAFDLTVGLALVAITEELVFRFSINFLGRQLKVGPWTIYAVSSVAFGLIHLPQGLLQVVVATGAGVLLMLVYRRTGSILVVIGAHYVADLIFFGHLLTPSV